MTDEYRALSAREVEEWHSGHAVWPGAIETPEGVLVPLEGLVVVGHFWNGGDRQVTTMPYAHWRAGMPAGCVQEILTTGTTQRGWSDFYLMSPESPLPEPRWMVTQ